MALQIKDIDAPAYKTIFIYGENGSGKTDLWSTMPGKIACVDYDASIEVLNKYPERKRRVTVFDGPQQWNDIQTMFKDPQLDAFDVLVLDNLTGLIRTLVKTCLQIPIQGEGKRLSPELPILRDYGLASERLRHIIDMFSQRKTKQHLVACAHTKVEKDEVTESIQGWPNTPGQTPAFILSKFSEQIFLKMEGDGIPKAYLKPYVWFSATTRVLTTKDFKNPNLATMYGLK